MRSCPTVKADCCDALQSGSPIAQGLEDGPWRRKWQPMPVFLPGESHAQRSLAGCSPWGRKELDTTEANTHLQGWGLGSVHQENEMQAGDRGRKS